jgi:hypothetical protein
MKIAICFSGQVRSLNLCIDNIKKNIIEKLPNKPDIFCHFSPFSDNFEKEWETAKLLNPTILKFEKDPEYSKELLELCEFKKGSGLHTGVSGLLGQLYSIYRSNELKKEFEIKNTFKYDVVFRIRPDQIYYGNLEDLNLVKNDSVYIPAHDYHGGINDRFAFGKSEIMDKFCSTYLNLFELIKLSRFHAETLAKTNCYINNINILNTSICCERVRKNGEIIPIHLG